MNVQPAIPTISALLKQLTEQLTLTKLLTSFVPALVLAVSIVLITGSLSGVSVLPAQDRCIVALRLSSLETLLYGSCRTEIPMNCSSIARKNCRPSNSTVSSDDAQPEGLLEQARHSLRELEERRQQELAVQGLALSPNQRVHELDLSFPEDPTPFITETISRHATEKAALEARRSAAAPGSAEWDRLNRLVAPAARTIEDLGILEKRLQRAAAMLAEARTQHIEATSIASNATLLLTNLDAMLGLVIVLAVVMTPLNCFLFVGLYDMRIRQLDDAEQNKRAPAIQEIRDAIDKTEESRKRHAREIIRLEERLAKTEKKHSEKKLGKLLALEQRRHDSLVQENAKRAQKLRELESRLLSERDNPMAIPPEVKNEIVASHYRYMEGAINLVIPVITAGVACSVFLSRGMRLNDVVGLLWIVGLAIGAILFVAGYKTYLSYRRKLSEVVARAQQRVPQPEPSAPTPTRDRADKRQAEIAGAAGAAALAAARHVRKRGER